MRNVFLYFFFTVCVCHFAIQATMEKAKAEAAEMMKKSKVLWNMKFSFCNMEYAILKNQ